MRVAKLSRILLLLALPAVPAARALAQDHPNVQPSAVRDQLMNAGNAAPSQQSAAPKPAATPAKKPAATKASAQTAQKPMAQTKPAMPAGAKAASKTPADKQAKTPVEKPAEEKAAARRDPFDALLNKAKSGNAVPENLPPGKAGLMVGALRIDGIVRSSGGMIAIVSNSQQRVYFLREGDKLYDGSVQHITLESISFQEVGKDAFGKPLEREVTRRLYPSPGEQQ